MNKCNLLMRKFSKFQVCKCKKTLLLKLGSELPNLVKKFQSILTIWAKCRLNFHELEYFQKPESAGV